MTPAIARAARTGVVCGLWIALLGAPVPDAGASTVRATSLQEMLDGSALVIEGRVLRVESVQSAGPGARIHTYVTLEVLDRIKGSGSEGQIRLRFAGGTVGERTLSVPGMRVPRVGERAIYFVESRTRTQVSPIYGWAQGELRIVRGENGALRVVTADLEPVVAVHTPSATGRAESSGVARGLVVDRASGSAAALTPAAFKDALRILLGPEGSER